jgi:acyl-CoA hydrolase
VAIGSQELYAQLNHQAFQFRPVSVTHGAAALAGIANLVTINSAIEVDLFGQAFAELTPRGLMSGPGGASDFARGARPGGGTRIVVLPAAAGGGRISRIVAPGRGSGPVSLGRMDVDLIVTEHGVADLRGTTYRARADALIAIASPDHRAGLASAWSAFSEQL